ncbi:MAG: GNAT family N-acetyltransferase [Patescibacteria group bacterium]
MRELKRLEENWDFPMERIQESLEFRDFIRKTYKKCKDYYFYVVDGKIQAIFPFFLLRSDIFGDRFISLPYLDVGGFSGEFDYKDIKKIIEEIKKKEIKHIEVRLNKFLPNYEKTKVALVRAGFQQQKTKQQFILKLTSEEDMWKRFHKHTRNDIRLAMKSDLDMKKIDNVKEMKSFFKLYVKEMRNFGTPQHSFKFFKNMFEIMKPLGLNCYKDGKIIGGLIMLKYKKEAYIMFNISKSKFRKYRPNDLLYWSAIRWAIDHKLKIIDLGQIDKEVEKGTHAHGLYKFKSKWLAELYDRVYFYYSKDQKTSGGNKEMYKGLRGLWRKIPLFGTKIIGPKIAAELGL